MSKPWIPAVFTLAAMLALAGCGQPQPTVPQPPPPAPTAQPIETALCAPQNILSPEDNAFLDDVQHRIFDYFWKEVFPETGIAIDHTENRIGKVAATGFELAALCIGVQRGWLAYEQGYERSLQILKMFDDDPEDPNDPVVEGHFGLFWHFVDGRTGQKMPVDCVAPCDSADLIAGAIVAGEFFKNTEVEKLARRIYDRVEWDQFISKKTDGAPGLMAFGWVPLHVSQTYYETDGLLNFNMSGFADNSLLIYALALGSDTHPIPQASWEEYVNSYLLDEYAGYECVAAGQLFCRQVPQSFIRFSRKRDRKIDYYLDTVNALLADRAFNMKENGYPPPLWGLTDCFGKDSYTHAAPPGPIMNDGTVGSTAFAGALPHVPRLALEAMKYVREQYGDRVWGPYGFTSSVNGRSNYVNQLYVGIELGPMIQLIENYRTGLIWDLFSRSDVMKNFVRRARMSGVVDDFELPPEAPPYAQWRAEGASWQVSGDTPQHGRKCLAIIPQTERCTLIGDLPPNDLLAFDYDRFFAFWARDLEPLECRLWIDGTATILREETRLPGAGWTHYFYRIPSHASNAALCRVAMELQCQGTQPALDNLSCEAQAPRQFSAAAGQLTARTGPLPGTLGLSWRSPPHSSEPPVERYRIKAVDLDQPDRVFHHELRPIAAPGQPEDRLLLLEPARAYALFVTALDTAGHIGPISPMVEGVTATGTLQRTIGRFDHGVPEGWEYPHPGWNMEPGADDNGPVLKVTYQKQTGWDFIAVPLDPRMAALHRYVIVRVKGPVELLGKLWCNDLLQENLQALRSGSDWTELRFDTHLATQIVPERDEVKKLLLFVQPGQWNARGLFHLGEIRYDD